MTQKLTKDQLNQRVKEIRATLDHFDFAEINAIEKGATDKLVKIVCGMRLAKMVGRPNEKWDDIKNEIHK